MSDPLRTQVLHRAAEHLGGKAPLRERLRVPMRELDAWLTGASRVPTPIFLAAVDMIGEAKRPGSAKDAILEQALQAAINETAAARGNVQLAGPEGLRIVAQRGFEKPFLDFFAVVDHRTPSSCGRAYELGESVVVEDVTADPIFAGTEAVEVMLVAGAIACQSTPILNRSGAVIGMLNTHFERSYRPSLRQLDAVKRIARETSIRLGALAGR